MENISVRRNFTPVPIYVPRVKFGPDGTARVHVKLPDTLTVFMLRAKAISGPDRFGFGTGQMRIRQPVVAQPALPRFVRPGDRFDAGLIARVVEGPGGAAHAADQRRRGPGRGRQGAGVRVAGTRPSRLDFPVTVPQPPPGQDAAQSALSAPARRGPRQRRAADRLADPAGPAAAASAPGARARHRTPGSTCRCPAPFGPDSYARTVTLAADPTVVKLVGGLNALLALSLRLHGAAHRP